MDWLKMNQDLIRTIRAEKRETFGTGRLRTRWKRCHEIAQRAIFNAPDGTVLVQGIEQYREHSWLELPDGSLWDPVTCESGTLKPQQVMGRYNRREVACKIIETRHYGWWQTENTNTDFLIVYDGEMYAYIPAKSGTKLYQGDEHDA